MGCCLQSDEDSMRECGILNAPTLTSGHTTGMLAMAAFGMLAMAAFSSTAQPLRGVIGRRGAADKGALGVLGWTGTTICPS